mgnify:CR=1 FL=1
MSLAIITQRPSPNLAPGSLAASREDGPPTLQAAIASLGGDPRQWLRQWHWKAALTSSTIRAALFFAMNLTEGLDAARGAALAELALRALTSGFYGAVTARFRRVEPRWAATAAVSVLLPLVSHSLEFWVHFLRGTAALIPSIAASALLTVGSTAFNLHLMRHGVLTVGRGSQSLLHDLRAMPTLLVSFMSGAGRQLRGPQLQPPASP